MLHTVFNSFVLVAVSELGDKTQLLAFYLTARFKKPWTIMAGIFTATILNHGLASYGGAWVAGLVPERTLGFILGATFILFGFWTLKPDSLEEQNKESRFGPFLTTTFLFFLAEMGDKTQLATVALGAQYASGLAVTTGTTLGMLVTDGLAVFLGETIAEKVQMRYVRWVAAALFFIFGAVAIHKALMF